MAALSFRDRLFNRRAARAITSPVGIAAGAVVGAGLVIGASLPVWVGVAAAAGVWAVNGLRLLPRGRRRERIDPFALHDPWRRFVQNALQARARYAETVHRAPGGPLRERLGEIGERMQTAVYESWLVARQGEALVQARRGIDLTDVERRLSASPPEAEVRALEAQRAAAERLDAVIARAESELRLLDARLDEAVARTLELTAHASTSAAAAGGLGSDVDALVSEMESLRQALDETGIVAGGGPGGTALPRRLPPGGSR